MLVAPGRMKYWRLSNGESKEKNHMLTLQGMRLPRKCQVGQPHQLNLKRGRKTRKTCSIFQIQIHGKDREAEDLTFILQKNQNVA